MKAQTGKLILIRHHESIWNKLEKWTGISDVNLTPYGKNMAFKIGQEIKDLPIDKIITSKLKRSIQTAEEILKGMDKPDIPIQKTEAINERDYGDYTGKNKWKMKEVLGKEKFKNIRRGWNCPVPGGETLKLVYERVIPHYQNNIIPELKNGKNILLVGHTNSLRALTKYIENISDKEIKDLDMPFNTINIYTVNKKGKLETKETRIIK